MTVIGFDNMPLEAAGEWPDLLRVVRERVLPERAKIGGYSVAENRKKRWWQFGTYAAALQKAIQGMFRCLVLSRVSGNHAVVFQSTDIYFSDALVIFPFDSFSAFALLQSRTHEFWARFLGSSMKDDLRYTSSDCFDTFSLPAEWHGRTALEESGRDYYEFRARLMVQNDEGLTSTYNRFHDPEEISPDILRLRELHSAMDRAVLGAYGFSDISTDCTFLLDYEDEEDTTSGEDYADASEGKGRKRKKPWRYRWPDEVRDEVLARLLALNQKRHEEEVRLGIAPGMKKPKTAAKKPRKTKAKDANQGEML